MNQEEKNKTDRPDIYIDYYMVRSSEFFGRIILHSVQAGVNQFGLFAV